MTRDAVFLLLVGLAVVNGLRVKTSADNCTSYITLNGDDDEYHLTFKDVIPSCTNQKWTYFLAGTSYFWSIDECRLNSDEKLMTLRISSNDTWNGSALTEMEFSGSPCRANNTEYDADDWYEASGVLVVELYNPLHINETQASFDITLYDWWKDFWHRWLGVIIGCAAGLLVIVVGICVCIFCCCASVCACCCCAAAS